MKINDFLFCETPQAWVKKAACELPTLLIDHANCEKKAASTALNLMYRYVDHPAMTMQLSKLAREELRHFEQVLSIIQAREIDYVHIGSARYAGELRKLVRTHEPARLVDLLIVSAIVEARSCERFEKVIPALDEELADFYASLLKSESRHFRVYLDFAHDLEADIDDRVAEFLTLEQTLIESLDPDFRFHSGVPKMSSRP